MQNSGLQNRPAEQPPEEEYLRLAAIVKFSDDAIIGTTLEGTIFSWNQGAEHIYGYTAEKITGQPLLNLIPPDHRDEVKTIFEKIRHGEHVDPFETRRMGRDGSVIHLSTELSCIRDGEGKISGASMITRDITQAREAQEALTLERILLRTVVDHLTDNLYVKDTAGRYILDNPAHRKFLGVESAEEVIGKTVFHFFPTEIATRYHGDDVEIIRSGKPLLNQEEPTVTKSGEKRLLLTTKVPFRDGKGEIAGLICLSRDITNTQPSAR